MDWTAVGITFWLALCTSLLLVAIGVPIAAWLVFSSRRWKVLVEAVVALPLVLPPTVLGFYLLVALGPESPLGYAVERVLGARVVFSFGGLLIASVIYSLPFMVQPLCAVFAGVDRKLIEASWCLGVSRAGTFFRLVVPLSIRGLIAGLVLSFAHTIGEFGVVLMVGGGIEGRTRTLSISIYDDVMAMNYARAHTTAAVLLVFSFLVLVITYSLLRRSPMRWRRA